MKLGRIGQALGDILHRAADGVATVERALRTAQHLDALDVVDVEDGGLRTVEVDVVEIDADALLEAGDRILLPDAADEGAERRVGAARYLERHVRRGVADVGDVERALILERLAAVGGDGDRHVLEIFRTAARGDENFTAVFVDNRGGGWRSFLRDGRNGDGGDGDAEKERRKESTGHVGTPKFACGWLIGSGFLPVTIQPYNES